MTAEHQLLTTIISGLPLTEAQQIRIQMAGGDVLMDDAAKRPVEALAIAERAEVWFGSGLNPNLLAAATRLKWLQTASVGAEYFLFPELARSAVTMTNVRQRHNSTCDHAMAMLLAVARNLAKQIREQEHSRWTKVTEAEVIQLAGTRALVMGTGQLGSGVARRAAAFGITVDGCSRSGLAHPSFGRVWPSAKLAEAVAGADWVINAIPFTPETKGIVSRAVFDAMKNGAVFINVGRGKTVDQDALRTALSSRKLRAAGLDVFIEEPLSAADPLWQLPNVIISPHAAGVTADGDPRELGLDALIENLARFRAGEPLMQPIDKVKGY